MRKIAISTLVLIWPHVALAGESTPLQDLMAGMGIATMCREKFNDQELFEAAAKQFISRSATASGKPDGFDAEVAVEGFRSTTPNLDEVNTNELSVSILKGMCSNMRQSLIE